MGYVYGYAQKARYEVQQEEHREWREGHFDAISRMAQAKFEERRETRRKLDDACDELQRTLHAIEKHKDLY